MEKTLVRRERPNWLQLLRGNRSQVLYSRQGQLITKETHEKGKNRKQEGENEIALESLSWMMLGTPKSTISNLYDAQRPAYSIASR